MDYPTEKMIYLRQAALTHEVETFRLAAIARRGKRRSGLLWRFEGLYHTLLVWSGRGLVNIGSRLQQQGQWLAFDSAITPRGCDPACGENLS